MEEILLKLVLRIAIIMAAVWLMFWISFSLDNQTTKSNAGHLKKMGFEVVTDGTKCYAKIKDGSWRTCDRILLAMGMGG